MLLRRVVGVLLAGTLGAACSGGSGAAPEDARRGGQAGADAGEGADAVAGGGHAGDGAARDAAAETDGVTSDAAGGDGAPPVDGDAAVRAGGCGMPAPALPVPAPRNGFVPFQVMTTGATPAGPQPAKAAPRSYWVRVPADYDPSRAYRTVFQTGFCQGSMQQPSILPLYSATAGGTDQAIYVAIAPPETDPMFPCYDTSSGAESSEFEAFALVHDAVAARYCVDEERVFVVSQGRSVANQLGCYFGGGPDPSRAFGRSLHVRGQAVVQGEGEPPMQPRCKGPVAAIWFDNTQGTLPQRPSTDALARVLAQDGCTDALPRGAWEGFPCTRETACPAGFPVVHCAMTFGRTDQEPLTVRMFETFMEQASPAP